MSSHVLVLVGRGRYEDPWHDHAATAVRVLRVLDDLQVPVTVRSTFPDALADATAESTALLVVAAGRGRVDPGFDGDDQAWVAFHARLAALVAQGVPLLGLHQAANTFADSPTWARDLGGRWVPDRSWHPPIGQASFRAVDVDHPVTTGLAGVEAYDERYCDLEIDRRSHVLLTAEHEGREHPVVWQAPGPGRVLYDGLGHDERSYESPSRSDLLRREIAWLLDASDGPRSRGRVRQTRRPE
ncbi:ThuA domain-containing protein [Actinotalea sp. K2]|uniref:ThuA domain-containing protein n=1 Tax=Actinotalea sp. K2 TaxID=2939438 RepID=UPI00201766CE|nr:ThuA domain-containing protein [Actinotalea sp. K2]MCL3859748.1 ThuA domain-containing protein [Actinotalea sp. K2]